MVQFRARRRAAPPDRRNGLEKREVDGFALTREDAFDETAPLTRDPVTPGVLRNDESRMVCLIRG
jgi:hypothetical protein